MMINCKSVANIHRNLTVCVKILIVLPENIHEFNI